MSWHVKASGKAIIVDTNQTPFSHPVIDSTLPCFLRNSMTFSVTKQRWLLAEEKLNAMGIPMFPSFRKAANLDQDVNVFKELVSPRHLASQA